MLNLTLLSTLTILFPPGTGQLGSEDSPPAEAPQASAPEPAPSSPQAGYDDGFYIRSEDGRSEFKIGGLMQVVGAVYGERRRPSSEFILKRIRPEFSGRFEESFRFQIEPNFQEDGVQLEEAWVGMEFNEAHSLLMAGRMKAPFGLEEVRSRRHIPFPAFSILNQFSPAEQHGLFVNGREQKIEYGLGAYNGGGGDETNDGKEVAARVMVHPYDDCVSSHVLRNLQFGVASTFGTDLRLLGGTVLRNAAAQPMAVFDPRARVDGNQWRLGLEAAWFSGPNMLQAEVLHMRQEMVASGGAANVDTIGTYISGQHVLSGEDVSFGGPSAPLGSRALDYGDGIWVAVARLSYLDFDDSLNDIDALLPGHGTANVTSLSLGMNLYLNQHVVLRNSLVHSLYAGQILANGHTISGELALLFELQMHF